jgi:hypothetical protein
MGRHRGAGSARPWIFGLCALAAGIGLLLFPRPGARRSGRPPRGLGVAIAGNGRLLVAEDAEGTVVDLFWPRPGMHPRIADQRDGTAPARRPPGSGIFAGIERRSSLRWLRDAPDAAPRATAGDILIGFRYEFPDGIALIQRDFVPPYRDLLLREYAVSGPPGALAGAALVWHARLRMARAGGDRAHYDAARGVILQEAMGAPGESVAIAASAPPASVSLATRLAEDALFTGSPGALPPPADTCEGEVDILARWPLAPAREGSRPESRLVVCLAFGPAAEATANAKQAIARPLDEQLRQARAAWASWTRSARRPAAPRIPGPAAGIPGQNPASPPAPVSTAPDALYGKSLAVLRMLSDRESGAIVSGARERWAYCWPRDSVFAAVALDLAGKHGEAARLYRFLARARGPGGAWEARYWADGQPVGDRRPPQLDAPGFVAWGAWVHRRLSPDGSRFARDYYPTVREAAAQILASLDPQLGLPGPGYDANEAGPPCFSAANAAVCFGGLRAAARLAEEAGKPEDARRYRQAAERIRTGVERFLWDPGRGRFRRTCRPESLGLDPYMAWLGAPFGIFPVGDPKVRATVDALRAGLRQRGGLYRGLVRSVGEDVWLHQNAIMAGYLHESGDRAEAERIAALLAAAATPFGTLPERIDGSTPQPTSTTPLAWAHAMYVILAWQRAGHPLPVP